MTAAEVITHLEKYDKYKGVKPYYIKKAIGGKKPATVNQLRNELIALSSSTVNKQPLPVKSANNIIQTQNLPDDVLKNTLLYSDLNTVINICTSNKKSMNLCDDQFWKAKLEHENIIILKNHTHFNDWVKYYKLALDAKREAEMMVNIVYSYNKYTGTPSIAVVGDDFMQVTYNIETKDWFMNLTKRSLKKTDKSDNIRNMKISTNEVILFITNYIIRTKNNEKYDFYDYTNENNIDIYYDNLKKNSKKIKPSSVSRVYLAMYDVLMNKL